MSLNVLRNGLAFVVGFVCSTALAGTATWTNFAANTPDTAYSWNDPGNWQDGYVGGTDPSDIVTIEPSETIYIKTPSAGVLVNRVMASANSYGAKARIIGDGSITVKSVAGSGARWGTLAQTYCDVVFPSTETSRPEIPRACFCGRVRNEYSSYIVGSSGTIEFRFDRYAESAGETRNGDLSSIGQFGVGSTPLWFYAPVGADAVVGTWRLKSGSRYAHRVSSSAHALAVGTTVSAAGHLPVGTFLRRVFDNATIELSEPAETSGETEDVTLEFAAFTPDFNVKFPDVYTQHGNSLTCYFVKTREQDSARVEFGEFFVRGVVGAGNLNFGHENDTAEQGTLVFRKVSGTGTFAQFNLRNTHFELGGGGDTGVTEFPANRPWTSPQVRTSRVTVTNNITGIVNVLTNFNGTIVKDGGGILKIGLGEASNRGSFTVEGGTLEIKRNATVVDGETLALNRLVLKSGTTLVLPEGGLTVAEFAPEAGATLAGAGELTVLDASNLKSGALGTILYPGAATVRFADKASVQVGEPAAQVFGHPAFWVDALRTDTITTNSAGGVTRWNDCRAGEPMFCTNVASAYPTLHCDSKAKMFNYVKIARVSTATKLEETQTLVWSQPIRGIKAVFLVTDPSDGGGVILGRTTARCPNSWYGSAGGPYYRGTTTHTITKPLAERDSSTPCVVNGRFFVNGVEVRGDASNGFEMYKRSGYSTFAYPQLVEHHVNTNYQAGAGSYELVCDAFGVCYSQPHADLGYHNGSMRICEYVIYTNSLSHTERLQTAQYLMRKWFGRNVYWRASDTNDTVDVSGAPVTVCVDEGGDSSIAAISSGSLAKEGGGTVHVDGMNVSSLDIRGGEVKVSSRSAYSELPHDTWLHMDASDRVAITFVEGNAKRIQKWADADGYGRTLVNTRPIRSDLANWASISNNAANGLSMVDIGPVYSYKSAGLTLADEDGNTYPSTGAGLDNNYEPPPLKTIFFVYDSARGGGTLMGGMGADWPGKGVLHDFTPTASPDLTTPIFYIDPSHWGNHVTSLKYGFGTLSNAYENGEALFRRNGEEINPFTTGFLHGLERVTFQWDGAKRTDTFGTFGDSMSGDKYTGNQWGGLMFGEIICYPRMLSADEIARVEAYLARKWSGIETPGYGAAKAGVLSVASGSTLTVLGLPFETASLSGEGTLVGDVRVTSGGELVVPVASDGSLGSGLVVSGNADFSSAGTVVLSGHGASLPAGTYLLLTADSITPPSEWTVTGGRRSSEYSILLEGGSIYLKVTKPGMILLVM